MMMKRQILYVSVLLTIFAASSSCSRSSEKCDTRQQTSNEVYLLAIDAAGSNVSPVLRTEMASKEGKNSLDCCSITIVRDDYKSRGLAKNVWSYVDIKRKYVLAKSAETDEPYRVEFDRCNKIVWRGLPYGG